MVSVPVLFAFLPSQISPPLPVMVPPDGPWQVVLDGLAQLRLPGLFLGRTSLCSPQSRRRQEKMLQRERIAKAWSRLPHASSPGNANAQAQRSFSFVFDLHCGVATQVQFVYGG